MGKGKPVGNGWVFSRVQVQVQIFWPSENLYLWLWVWVQVTSHRAVTTRFACRSNRLDLQGFWNAKQRTIPAVWTVVLQFHSKPDLQFGSMELLNLNQTSSPIWSLNRTCITTKPMGTCRWVQVRVTPGSNYVDPCENPYPPSGYGYGYFQKYLGVTRAFH